MPARIEEIYSRDGLQMARVDFGGVSREVCLDYVPEAKVGEYCIIHVGFAISLLSEEEAKETLALLNEIADIENREP
ncbi:MAG: HypC/HybG/HupF family hydrogenase formation chaperone [Anaerolineae bacterium]